MSIFIVDVESDGPIPGIYSMVSFAAVKVESSLSITFKATLAPISNNYILESLNVSHVTREEHEKFPNPNIAMHDFFNWVLKNNNGKCVFMSDNPCFDWQFINYYFHLYCKSNPFGHSGRRIGDFYSGIEKNWTSSSKWKKYRNTKHTHDPLDDAIGNAQAFIHFTKINNIYIPFN